MPKSEPTESNEDQLDTPTTGVQLAATETMQPSAYVNAAGFIPGDRAPTPTVPVQVKPEVAVKEPESTLESVPQPRIVLESEAQVAEPPQLMTTRPRISFVHHGTPGSLMPLNQTEDAEGIAESAEQKPEDAEPNQAEGMEDEGEEYEEEVEVEETQEPFKPIEQIPQRVQPKPVVSTTATVVPSLSLQTLKQGTAPQVKFSGNQSAVGNMAGQPTGDQPRKRKRKRKRGGGGGSGQVPVNPGMTQPQPRPELPQQAKSPISPVQSTGQKPAMSPPPGWEQAVPVQSKPQPAQQPPAPKPVVPKPAPVNDPNKVSWGELLE